jgi:hypothetical protein
MTADTSFDVENLPEPTPHDRLREVAAIFAAGLIRLHERAALPAVRFVRDSIAVATWRAAGTPAGGEVLGNDW